MIPDDGEVNGVADCVRFALIVDAEPINYVLLLLGEVISNNFKI